MAPVGPFWGEIPRYIRGRRWLEGSFIRRNLQLSLPLHFPAQVVTIPAKPIHRDARGWKVDPYIWNLQPRKWPVGWYSKAMKNPNWRHVYRDEWIAKRKALGLPHEVHSDIWFHKPIAARKSA